MVGRCCRCNHKEGVVMGGAHGQDEGGQVTETGIEVAPRGRQPREDLKPKFNNNQQLSKASLFLNVQQCNLHTSVAR